MNFIGKNVLVIGSGSDLNDCALGSRIDGGEWDVVCRLYSKYGSDSDTGTRTDFIFSTGKEDDREHWGEEYSGVPRVITGEEYGISKRELVNLGLEVFGNTGNMVSMLGVAVNYFVIRGAKNVSVIGLGGDGVESNGTSQRVGILPQEIEWLQKWANLLP